MEDFRDGFLKREILKMRKGRGLYNRVEEQPTCSENPVTGSKKKTTTDSGSGGEGEKGQNKVLKD